MPPKKVIAEGKFSEILEEVLQPIKDSLKKLITHENLANLLNGLEEKLLKKMEGQAEELKDLKRKTDHLEGRVAILENLVQTLERKTDDVEQYGRRLCLRIDNIPISEGENPKVIEQELQKEFVNMGVELPEDAIDRAHRIGKKYDVEVEEVDGTTTEVTKQQVIVRFSIWKYRTLMYRNRNKRKKVRIKIDLTKRRLELLSYARDITKGVEGIEYVFCDVSCRLNVKLSNGRFRAFNSITELASIIANLD